MDGTQVRRRRSATEAVAEAPATESSGPSLRASLGNSEIQRAVSGDDLGGMGAIARSVAGSGAPSNQAMLRSAESGGDTDVLPGLSAAGGFPLPDAMRARFEAAMGHPFGHVRIHDGPTAHQAAERLGAEAFALGSHIFMGGSQWNSADGERLLAHELTHVVQADEGRLPGTGGVSKPTDPTEREAYGAEDGIVRRLARVDEGFASPVSAAGPVPVARAHPKLTFPLAVRHARVALVGDGTPANQGLTLDDLSTYVATQPDWFSEPSLTPADRDTVWRLLLMLKAQPALLSAAGGLKVAEIAGLAAADLAIVQLLATGYDPNALAIRLAKRPATLARALALGGAMQKLAAFVPALALKIVVPESGLEFLVDNAKVPELQAYFTQFTPTLETPEEWPFIEELLTEGVAPYASLVGWIHDLHIFTKNTRKRLVTNYADTSRSFPVSLTLYSGSDWSAAFLQSNDHEAIVSDGRILGLIVQGPQTMAAATGLVTKVADTYGQTRTYFDWGAFEWVTEPGHLDQVILSGHGAALVSELASKPTNPHLINQDRSVAYDEQGLDGTPVAGSDTEKLIDTIIGRSAPSGAHIVFDGCLVNSHQTSPGLNLGNPLTAEAALRADLAASPNLADYVRSRIALSGKGGDVVAANASTTEGSLKLDGAHRAQLAPVEDPQVAHSKFDYLKGGREPEGILSAVLECYADAAIGPAKVTDAMRARQPALQAAVDFWLVISRVSFSQVLPAAPGLVDIAKVHDLVHRISQWLESGQESTMDPTLLAGATRPGEFLPLYNAFASSNIKSRDYFKVGFRMAWLSVDPAQTGPLMAALDASTLSTKTLLPILPMPFVQPHLATLLPPSATPSYGQMLLALTIAETMGVGMPPDVKTMLRAAAGGVPAVAFPAAAGINNIMFTGDQRAILEAVGLGIGAAPVVPVGGSVPANVDMNQNGRNDTRVDVGIRETTAKAATAVRRAPNGKSRLAALNPGDPVRVMGTQGVWSMIDSNGKIGFVRTADLN